MIALFASQVGPIWLEVPALLVVPEGRYHDLVQDLPVDGRVLDGNQELDQPPTVGDGHSRPRAPRGLPRGDPAGPDMKARAGQLPAGVPKGAA